jgi:site-specific recombinase XerD
VHFGHNTAKALWKHLEEVGKCFGPEAVSEHAFAFCTERGPRAGNCILPRALYSIIDDIAARARVSNAHPHRFRHTFALKFLRNGGNQLTLMRLMGHTSLEMTKRYVALVQADLKEQHRKFSPGDRING